MSSLSTPTPPTAGSRRGLWVVVTLAALAGGAAVGAAGLGWTGLEPVADRFGRGELLGWSVLALLTGGVVFGPRDRRPPVLASGLVGTAALLGATPVQGAVIGLAGAIGGFRRVADLPVPRLVAGGLGGWALPGVLMAAAAVGGPALGRDGLVQLGEVAALWAVLALLVPVGEAVGTWLVQPPAEQIGIRHMLARRLEPQSVLAALAVVAALSYVAIGAAAALVVLLPAVAARIGFALHDDGRRAVSQTLAAMTVLPEWVGIVHVGHSARVRDVVEQVAVELGLDSRLRRDLVRAAELHELGRLDGGIVRGNRGRVARSGAAVLEQAAMRRRVVSLVAATDPDSDPAGEIDRWADVVTAACERDQQEPARDPRAAAADVLAALRLA